MRRLLLLICLLLGAPTAGRADCGTVARADTSDWRLDAPQVVVRGRRPMKEIGLQQTRLDTAALRSTVAASLADVLAQHSTLFIKQYGRGTLSTASFRGTAPSPTQVTWNGMRINSPTLGMTDFSTLPAYFIDRATLLHGSSSLRAASGGLGGAVVLATEPSHAQGLGLQYIQGVGSFRTTDEFARITYGRGRWQSSTRFSYASSPNDYPYTNYHKKVTRYDEAHRPIGSYYPTERNRSGDYHDLNLLQEVWYRTGRGDRLSLSGWYQRSRRGIPMLDVDYKETADYANRQNEQTVRGVVAWDRTRQAYKLRAQGGYAYTELAYDYSRDRGDGNRVEMIRSRSYTHTIHGSVAGDYYLGERWMFTTDVSLHQHLVASRDRNAAATASGPARTTGYDQARAELSGYVSVRWQPTERLGVAVSLREELCGRTWSPVIPAGFVDLLLSRRGAVTLKGSVSRNYRFPTLNDLYFLPGGNPDLRHESGFTYDAGLSFAIHPSSGRYTLRGEATWFDSRIDDWILWLPTFNGLWTPRNVRQVHAYGVEVKIGGEVRLGREWKLGGEGNFAWTPSINRGDPVNWADGSIGRQLVYIPEYSAAATGRLTWRNWQLVYQWNYCSERYTTSSNETATRIGRVLPYFMNNLSLEKRFTPRWAELSAKVRINNLFDEEYESVLSRPMPGLNFEVFLEIKPRFGRGSR